MMSATNLALLAVFLLIIPVSKASATKPDFVKVPDVKELSNGKKVSYQLKNGMLLGVFRYFYNDGKIATEGRFENGDRIGIWNDWYSNGQLAMTRTYNRGFETTVEAQWPNGEKAVKGQYSRGVRTGIWELHDSSGGLWAYMNADGLFDPDYVFYTQNDQVENKAHHVFPKELSNEILHPELHTFVFTIRDNNGRARLQWHVGRWSERLVENNDPNPRLTGLHYIFDYDVDCQANDAEFLGCAYTLPRRIQGLMNKGKHVHTWTLHTQKIKYNKKGRPSIFSTTNRKYQIRKKNSNFRQNIIHSQYELNRNLTHREIDTIWVQMDNYNEWKDLLAVRKVSTPDTWTLYHPYDLRQMGSMNITAIDALTIEIDSIGLKGHSVLFFDIENNSLNILENKIGKWSKDKPDHNLAPEETRYAEAFPNLTDFEIYLMGLVRTELHGEQQYTLNSQLYTEIYNHGFLIKRLITK